MHASALIVLLTSASQVHPVSKTEPDLCVAVVEEMGNVGLRISHAQGVASDVVTGLRKRMGYERLLFEGTYTGKLGMKKKVGFSDAMQDAELAYLKAAIEHASYRVRVRFGSKKKGVHWITLTCRKADAKPNDTLESKRVVGTTFAKSRAKMKEELAGFCTQMDPNPAADAAAAKVNASGPLPPKKKKTKKWTVPPRR
jgi:hypothetical protein